MRIILLSSVGNGKKSLERCPASNFDYKNRKEKMADSFPGDVVSYLL